MFPSILHILNDNQSQPSQSSPSVRRHCFSNIELLNTNKNQVGSGGLFIKDLLNSRINDGDNNLCLQPVNKFNNFTGFNGINFLLNKNEMDINNDDTDYDTDEEKERHIGLSFLREKNVAYSSPMFSIKTKSIADMSFDDVCSDPHIVVNPGRMGFIPSLIWSDETISFGFLVQTFFRKRNSSSSKFPHKLYNALKLSEYYPEFRRIVGICWVTDDVFRVDRNAFARLIGVKSVEGGLFHQQGNFPSHGFVELDFQQSEKLSLQHGFGHADLSEVRFIKSIQGHFTKYSTEKEIETFKWCAKPAI